ncbi:MAG: hypothetical protein M1826_007575 [Phylliscum demangeonii]|nr:MAG: hypothetical protein M1826_007575 [Phylliscum demangeonii]
MDRRGEFRSKRKHPPAAAVADRPAKQMRSERSDAVMEKAGELQTGLTMKDDPLSPPSDSASDLDDPVLPLAAAGPPDTAEWQATIERVIRNVVAIRFCQTCPFDTAPACSSEATGFVVDAERGFILTNRHVVCAGPFWGYCIFDNHEECDVYPVYRDPVHDFGILRFDPKAIKYMPVAALPLRPDLARVGVEIRVVGNDAGEKLSILSGVISRLDRNAPEYGEGYSDFNTNYIQAAAAASGGSSGSPVVNIDGFAVALQAGGRSDGAATDYFLPLDRPARALKCLQDGEPIARGTIQCQWIIKPFDECRRLGLRPDTEGEVRAHFPKETGMLVAEIVLPEGPAHTKIEEGDVLIRVNGELLTQFVRLDDILDTHVGRKVTFTVQRGGEDLEAELDVGDLHAITPDRFVTVTGASCHDLSYQQARLYAIPVRGVYVSEAVGSFSFERYQFGWLIQSIDNKKTPDLTTFIEVMKAIPDRARVVMTWKNLDDLHTLHTCIIHINRHWTSKMRMAIRNDATGKWDYTDLADALPPEPPVPRSANFIRLDSVRHSAAAELIRSFVRVECNVPVLLDGVPRGSNVGFGLVVDAGKGLVVVSRAIVPYDLCDISITVADSIIVDGTVLFLHPLQNYAIIQYDPALVQAPVKSAELSERTIRQGDSTIFLGFNENLRVSVANTTVTDITTVAVPANSYSPRYRAINLDAITVDTSLGSQCGSGVLVAEDGTVEALWLSYTGERSQSSRRDVEYHLGLASPTLLSVVRQVQRGEVPKLRIINAEFQTVHMSQARIMGVTEQWIERVSVENRERHQLFMVRKVTCGHEETLREGDVLLTLNGKLITRVSELDVMYDQTTLDVLVVRDRVEMHLQVTTVSTEDLETDHAVIFCGAVLQRPHHAVRQQISKMPSQIYVSDRVRGSPSFQYGLPTTNFITGVNGVATLTLDAFIKAVVQIPDNTYFRLKVVTFDDIPWVATMKKNDHYFPMMEFIKDPRETGGWTRQTYDEKGQVTADLSLLPNRCDYQDDGTLILLDANENAFGPGLALPPDGAAAAHGDGIGDGKDGPAEANGSGSASEMTLDLDLGRLNRYPDPHQTTLKQRFCDYRNGQLAALSSSAVSGADTASAASANPTANGATLSDANPTAGLLQPAHLFVGVGSDEAIDGIMRCFCVPGRDQMIICPPTYGMYSVCAQVNDVAIVSVPLDVAHDFQPDTDALLATLSAPAHHIKLIYLCSPGNPTGHVIAPGAVRALLAHPTWNGIVVVDEAYIDFAARGPAAATFAAWVPHHPNLIVLQTLSKAFGLAGIRLGLAIAPRPIAALLNALKAPYNVSALASAVACAALAPAGPHLRVMHAHRAAILAQRDRLAAALRETPGVGRLRGGPDANFLLVEMLDVEEEAAGTAGTRTGAGTGMGTASNEVALAVYTALATHRGVVVRFRGAELGCHGCLRVTVGTPAEVDHFVAQLRHVLRAVFWRRERERAREPEKEEEKMQKERKERKEQQRANDVVA